MNKITWNSNLLFFLFFLALFLLALIDSAYWANVSQWREDQGMNIWLGFTQKISEISIGIPSSRKIPNPNGAVFVGAVLSIFPSLWWSSFILGIFNKIVILLFSYLAFNNKKFSLLFAILLLSLINLRNASCELWNNWLLISVNLLYFSVLIKYFKKRTFFYAMLIYLFILLPPSFYLGGVLNSICYFVCSTFVLYCFPVSEKKNAKNLSFNFIVLLIVIFLFVYYVYYPYFSTIEFKALVDFPKPPIHLRLERFIREIIRFPLTLIFFFCSFFKCSNLLFFC
ncbi:MAG: hypothetical protein HQK51_18730 [Oligoflexia bacterium]|nr:hypothetical protein [Oligoflexia bacterium]